MGREDIPSWLWASPHMCRKEASSLAAVWLWRKGLQTPSCQQYLALPENPTACYYWKRDIPAVSLYKEHVEICNISDTITGTVCDREREDYKEQIRHH